MSWQEIESEEKPPARYLDDNFISQASVSFGHLFLLLPWLALSLLILRSLTPMKKPDEASPITLPALETTKQLKSLRHYWTMPTFRSSSDGCHGCQISYLCVIYDPSDLSESGVEFLCQMRTQSAVCSHRLNAAQKHLIRGTLISQSRCSQVGSLLFSHLLG